MIDPPPGGDWIFVEEHPDSMNDPAFYSPYSTASAFQGIDVPANFHDGAANFSFGDGHVEQHRWKGGARTAPVLFQGYADMGSNQADLKYLFDHTQRLQP